MSILLLPHNIPDSLKHLSTMVDDIWYYAGDRSTDVSVSLLLTLICPFSFSLFVCSIHVLSEGVTCLHCFSLHTLFPFFLTPCFLLLKCW